MSMERTGSGVGGQMAGNCREVLAWQSRPEAVAMLFSVLFLGPQKMFPFLRRAVRGWSGSEPWVERLPGSPEACIFRVGLG